MSESQVELDLRRDNSGHNSISQSDEGFFNGGSNLPLNNFAPINSEFAS